jgi:hypothetical protein
MNSNRAVIYVSAAIAVLAIAATLIKIGQPVQFLAALGGILAGPGSLAYRLLAKAKWPECLMVGLALNVAALMVVAFAIVAVNFWHPKVELLIPATTCVLALVLYRRDVSGNGWAATSNEPVGNG